MFNIVSHSFILSYNSLKNSSFYTPRNFTSFHNTLTIFHRFFNIFHSVRSWFSVRCYTNKKIYSRRSTTAGLTRFWRCRQSFLNRCCKYICQISRLKVAILKKLVYSLFVVSLKWRHTRKLARFHRDCFAVHWYFK